MFLLKNFDLLRHLVYGEAVETEVEPGKSRPHQPASNELTLNFAVYAKGFVIKKR